MKKSLLLGLSLGLSFGLYSQASRLVRQNNSSFKMDLKGIYQEPIINDNINYAPTVNNTQKLLAPPYSRFTSTRNNYGYYVSQLQTILTYNQDLNAVLYTQRFTNTWGNYNATSNPTGLNPAAGAGASGYMMAKWTTNNGGSWDSTFLFRNDVNAARFQNGTIYNPPGNSSLSNALIVASGPCTASSNWTGNWFSSAHMITGTNGVQAEGTTRKSRFYPTNTSPLNGFGKNISFARNYAVTANNKVWIIGGKSTNYNTGSYGIAIIKGSYDAAGDSMQWAVDSSLINTTNNTIWTVASDGEANNLEGKIAFSPNGQIGYLLVNGSDNAATDVKIKGSYQPMLWKTTDGGNNWSRVNANYNWTAAGNGNFIYNLIPTRSDTTLVLPAFFDTYGGEITVDANGVLHYVTAVVPAVRTHVDSLGYSYTYPFSFQKQYSFDRPWVWDLTTDGSGSWNGKLVAQLYTNSTGSDPAQDSTASEGVWLDQNGTTYTPHDHRVQITRSNDGSKIFYSWLDSDTTQTVGQNQYGYLNPPSIHYRGLDVSTGLYSPVKINDAQNTFGGNIGFWWYIASDNAMPTANGFRIPGVFSDSQDQGYSSLAALDVYYVDDIEISNTEYTESINLWEIPVVVGLNEINQSAISTVSQNFPNPFATTSVINVTLNKAEVITVNVTNLAGQVVLSKVVKGNAGVNQITVDAASLESGIYFYNVVAGDSKVTRKMSVVK